MPSIPLSASPLPTAQPRLPSIDVYRGFVMLLMMAEVLQLPRIAASHPESTFWQWLGWHQSHVAWVGCSLHDLIQPSFSFLVGTALAFSIAKRQALGQSMSRLWGHAFGRAVILILLGVFLRSTHSRQTNWTFEDTLSQIGLGYLFLFMLAWRSRFQQWASFVLILIGYSVAFLLYNPPADFDLAKVGVAVNSPHLQTGLASHWNMNSNLAWAFDTWFLNLFPRQSPFTHNGGGYATLSFIPTLATMILGLLAGGILKSPRTSQEKLRWLALAAILCFISSFLLHFSGVSPIVKKIWTPGWVLFSGGWCLTLLAAFYYVFDIKGPQRWSMPLLVVGMNSIAAYVMAHLFDGFIGKNLKTNLGQDSFKFLGDKLEPLVHGASILFILWLLLYWMYRRKIFLRI